MSSISSFAQSPFSVYTSLGPRHMPALDNQPISEQVPGGFSGMSLGVPALPQGFGFGPLVAGSLPPRPDPAESPLVKAPTSGLAEDLSLMRLNTQLSSGRIPSLAEMQDILQSANLDPESQAYQAFRAKVAQAFEGKGAKAKLRLEQALTHDSLKTLNQQINRALTSPSVSPNNGESPIVISPQARLSSMRSLQESLQSRFNTLLFQDPSRGAAITNNNPLVRNTQGKDEQILTNLQRELAQGRIPSLEHLKDAISHPAESPTAMAMQSRMSALLSTYGGPQGQIRARQLALAMEIGSYENTLAAMTVTNAKLQPGSPQAVAAQNRQRAATFGLAHLKVQLDQLLAADPYHGQATGPQNMLFPNPMDWLGGFGMPPWFGGGGNNPLFGLVNNFFRNPMFLF